MSGGASFVARGPGGVDQEALDNVILFLSQNPLDKAMDIVMNIYGPECRIPDDNKTRTLDEWKAFFASKRDHETNSWILGLLNSILSALSQHEEKLKQKESSKAARALPGLGEGAAIAAAPEQEEGGARRTDQYSHPSLEFLTSTVSTRDGAEYRARYIFNHLLKPIKSDLLDVVVDEINRKHHAEKIRRVVKNMFQPSDEKDAGPAKRKRDDRGDGGDRRDGA